MKNKIDKSNMRETILNFPNQFEIGTQAAKDVKVNGTFDSVMICGMGGSALPGDILDMWKQLHQINLPLIINRNYHIPKINSKCLAVCISYSGNTEETINSYKEARKQGLKIAAITTGGKLGKLCKKDKTPVAIVPPGIPPRLAIGYQFSALMKILSNAGLIEDKSKLIQSLKRKIKPKEEEKKGQELAKTLKGKIPIIYASSEQRILARIWKINLCENSKVLAFYNFFPELCHNEINGFWKINKQIDAKKVQIIVLRDRKSYNRILKQMQIVNDLIKKEKVNARFVDISGRDPFEKIFSNLILGIWTSYYLAILYNIDPSLIEMIEKFKKRLNSKA